MDWKLPELGEGVYEAEMVRWLVEVGSTVRPGQGLLEVMTDKATMEVPAPFAGTITRLAAEPGQQLKVGEVVLSYDRGEVEAPTTTASDGVGNGAVAVAATPTAPAGMELRVRAAPSVRQMARKLGIDLNRVHGSGPDGRVLLDDLATFDRAPPPSTPPTAPVAERPLDFGRPGTRIKVVGLRRRIAEQMVLAKRTIPHYSYVDECDVTELVRVREGLKETYARAGVRLTYLAFAVKAVVEALKEVPLVNSSLDESAGEIVLHDRYDIGVAVASPAGLLVPVIRDAHRKDVAQVAREIERLSADARNGRAKLEDLRGSTFTITSIGNIGGLISTPVINHPEVGILGIGRIVKRPVYDATGNLRPADIVYLSWSFDHRVVDGAIGAHFANAILHRLRNPLPLLASGLVAERS